MERLTPVIVGVGQLANKDDRRIATPLELIADAVRLAVADSESMSLGRIEGVFLSPPWVSGSEGAATDLGARLGLAPGVRKVGTFSGSMPQELLAQACQAIADGSLRAAVVAGGVADASVRRAVKRGLEPVAPASAQWTWSPADRRAAAADRTAESAAGLNSARSLFALVESRLAQRGRRSPTEQREWLGRVMAPFSAVAGRRPELAWFPYAKEPAEISGVRADNRLVCEPYTKLMNSFPDVDLAAAIIVMSTEMADELKVPAHRRVFPWSTASCHEPYAPSERPEICEPQALAAAVTTTLQAVNVTLADIDRFDLYSCFPAAVQLGAAALGLDVFDPRGLTVTGGLPYFGGPGAAYVVQSIASMVEECRAQPGSIGAVVAVGGRVSNFAAGLYSSAPSELPWAYNDCAEREKGLLDERVPVDLGATGVATVEAMTVLHDRHDGAYAAPVFARFGDGRRSGARLADPRVAAQLSGTTLIGTDIRISLVDGRPVYEPL